jgi:hypothetical protein
MYHTDTDDFGSCLVFMWECGVKGKGESGGSNFQHKI